MGHINNLGQQCDGVLCTVCTRCSNCRYQKPGQYKKHEHDFTGESSHAEQVETAPRTRSKRGATL